MLAAAIMNVWHGAGCRAILDRPKQRARQEGASVGQIQIENLSDLKNVP
jgi:hypothetical protein